MVGTRSIDMLEYALYDLPCNGSVHIVVPNKLLVFRCPEDLGNTMWVDRGCGRAFSPNFYAQLLGDFDVSEVLRMSKDDYAADTFQDCGIHVEDLMLEGVDESQLLRKIDRFKFLTLVRCAPGAVTIHGTRGSGLGASTALVASYLITAHGMTATGAQQWLHITYPPSRSDCASTRSLHTSHPFLADAAAALSAGGAGAVSSLPCSWGTCAEEEAGAAADFLRTGDGAILPRTGCRELELEGGGGLRRRLSESMVASALSPTAYGDLFDLGLGVGAPELRRSSTECCRCGAASLWA